MKRKTVLIILLCALLLSGCGRADNPYQVDTVVRIPVNPTEAATVVPTEAEETAAPTQAPAETAAPTEVPELAETTEPTEGKSESGGKTSSPTKKSTSDVTKSTKATEPPATQPPATEPETQPPTEAEETVPVTEPPVDPSDYSVGSLEYEILDALNAYRAEAGLSALTLDRRLSGIAALRAEECSTFWSHTRPDGRGYTTAMSDYGYGFGSAAQCLAQVGSSGSGADIAAKWMNSDNKNAILNENFTTVGIGIFRANGVTIVAALLVG